MRLLRSFLQTGGKEAEFWALTPRQYWEHMKAHQDRLVSEHRTWTTRLYVGAWLQRVADFPKLDALMEGHTGGERKLDHEVVAGQMRSMTSTMPKRSWQEWLGASSAA